MNSGSKTVCGRVAGLDGVFLGLELGDGADGAEDFLLHDLHVISDVGEDGRLNEVADIALTLATSFDCSTGLLAFVNVTKKTTLEHNRRGQGIQAMDAYPMMRSN